MLSGLTSHIPQITESASIGVVLVQVFQQILQSLTFNEVEFQAPVLDVISVGGMLPRQRWTDHTTGTTSPIPLSLAAAVSVSPAVPADVTPLRLTGHTTGTGDNTGLILVSAFGIVAVPGDYDVSFSLTDFTLVCPLALHVHAANVFVPPSLGLFMNQVFSHMHLCLFFDFLI